MKIAILGIGYVGVVSAACLLKRGHDVVGVDLVESKVESLAAGKSPISEPKVDELLSIGHKDGRLSAATTSIDAVSKSDMVWICVGTPSSSTGHVDLTAIKSAFRQLGNDLTQTSNRPLIVVRSTLLPGTSTNDLIPVLESASGLKANAEIDVVYHPEFLREGNAVDDFENPPKIVVGESVVGASDRLLQIYEGFSAEVFRLAIPEAELIKYYDNVFHAVKITFANEMGLVAKSLGIDARRVSEVFRADKKLNISERYLKPGFAFGGSCLPKDLRALLRISSENCVDIGMLSAILSSNRSQVDRLVQQILSKRPAVVGIVGIAFKPNTDDLRESPYVSVAKQLIGEGVDVKIFDENVRPDNLIGRNKMEAANAFVHLKDLLVPSLDGLESCDLILVNHDVVSESDISQWLKRDIFVMDLVGIEGAKGMVNDLYDGVAW